MRSASPGSQGHSHEPLHETCVVFALCGLAGDSRRWPLLRHPADLREVTMRRVGVMGTVSGRSGCLALPSGEGRACHTTSDGPYLCAVSPSSELFTSFLSLLPERCEHQHARQTTARCQVTRALKTSSPESRLWAGAAVWVASRRSLGSVPAPPPVGARPEPARLGNWVRNGDLIGVAARSLLLDVHLDFFCRHDWSGP